MERIPEPELMDDGDQAAAYASANFGEVNQEFVDRFFELAPTLDEGRVVDLGCGPGDIAVRVCRARPGLHVTAVDGAPAMLDHAREAIRQADLDDRVRIVQSLLPGGMEGETFDAVISNSLLHHLPNPNVLWTEIRRLGKPGAPVLVVDLFRPATRADAAAIVDTYSADEPDVLRRDFYNSLLAAFTPAEVRAQLRATGLGDALRVDEITDRHIAVTGFVK